MLLCWTTPLPPGSVMVLLQVKASAAPLFSIAPKSNAAPKLTADPTFALFMAVLAFVFNRISNSRIDT
jgi:hypothetical protein